MLSKLKTHQFIKKNFFFFSCLSYFAFAEYSLKLVDSKTFSPLSETEVLLVNFVTTVKTDENGIIQLTENQVSNGEIKIAIISPQINYQEITIALKAGEMTLHQVKLKKRNLKELRDITIRSKTKTVSQKFISKEELADNFQVNYNDIAKTLQTQPGISSSGSSTDSSLFIQGGGGEEWVGIFDNVYILTPTRWGGAVSMFNPSVIDNVSFYSGGYPSKYANGLSGVLDISVLSPNPNKWQFYGVIDNSVEFIAHGPINKNVGSLVQIRRTWIDFLQELYPDAPIFIESGGGDGIEQAPYILDGLSKFQFQLADDTTLTFLLYGSMEGLNLDLNYVIVNNPNQTGEESRFSYEENNFIASLSLQHFFSSLNSLNITAAYTPRFLHYRQNDNGIREVDNKVRQHSTQIGIRYNHGAVDKHNIQVGGLAYLFIGEIDFDEKRYYINAQEIYSVDDRVFNHNRTRLVLSAYLSDDWFLAKFLVMQYGFTLNFRSVTDEIFIAPRLGFEFLLSQRSALHLRSGLYNFHDFDYLKTYINSDFQSQKAFHLVAGGKFQIGRVRFLGEGFYKNYWDLLERRPDGGFENTGVREVGGFALNLQLTRSDQDIFSGYTSYTFQRGTERITERSLATANDFETARIRELPEVGENFTPTYLREHTLALYVKATPFKKLRTRLSTKRSSWINDQYFALEFAFLSSKPETSITSVVKTTDTADEIRFLLQRDSFNNTTTPPIIKLNLQYGIPINKHFDVFVTFINVLNHQNVLYYNYSITSEFQGGSETNGTYGSDKITTIPNIDNRFTVRGGLKIRY